ncbi:hypothetical protein BV898_11960 [Hypsibius exemplaris]|uniref:Uncharacterized protein n=1 Tax=Hypsibius exemplaris TaxID=2072580 RepID=A0A1W0WF76_HYPEX|nr:hypothetical protein BV898_11960 [Hypsibius exemplaris]
MEKEKACQDLLRVALANRPQNRYACGVKLGNWRGDRIQRQHQGEIFASTQPPMFDWDIAGKVGSCEDQMRKREYQSHIVEKMECMSDKANYNCTDSCMKPRFGLVSGELPIRRHQAAYYNELDDPRMNNIFSKNDEDCSNGMKTHWERANHHMYEGYEPAYKTPKICQHKKDFFPVNINWGLGFEYRKKLALREMTRKNCYVTNYMVEYGDDPRHFDYKDPECRPKQKPLVMYRRPEMGECADMPLTPLQQLHPPKANY